MDPLVDNICVFLDMPACTIMILYMWYIFLKDGALTRICPCVSFFVFYDTVAEIHQILVAS